MPAWLDMLRTPLAAPETRGLRRRRHLWQALCFALAASILLLPVLRAIIGRSASIICAVLTCAAVIVGILYFRMKNAADDAWLARTAGEGEP